MKSDTYILQAEADGIPFSFFGKNYIGINHICCGILISDENGDECTSKTVFNFFLNYLQNLQPPKSQSNV